jgi:hypothetical protein
MCKARFKYMIFNWNFITITYNFKIKKKMLRKFTRENSFSMQPAPVAAKSQTPSINLDMAPVMSISGPGMFRRMSTRS